MATLLYGGGLGDNCDEAGSGGDDADSVDEAHDCINNDNAVCIVDDGRIKFADFCKLMKQQQQALGDETRLPEQDTRHVFRVSI